MNKSLLKEKLKSYSALATAVFGTAAAADAQIIYTDVNPDAVLTITNGTINDYIVDFNNDGNEDMAVATYGYLYNYGGTDYQINYVFSFVAQNATAALVGTMQTIGSQQAPITTNLTAGTVIGASSAWLDTTAAGGTTYFSAGYGLGQSFVGTGNTGQDIYYGARFLIGTNTHYGWVRVNIATDASQATIKDYAYNSTPNGPINAGQTAGISEISAASWSAYGNGSSIKIKSSIEGNIEVIDLTGKTIASGAIKNGELTMNVANANTGMYIVRITNGSLTDTKKIVLN